MSNAAEFALSQTVENLYADHHGWLVGWLRRRLGDRADAADLAQDTFLRLLVKPAARRLDNLAETRAYLRTVADHLCIDLWRRRQVEQAWADTLAT
ncbi:sigma factor [Xylophilus sp.]|uniref:sigma factor n=1 Tax=Xylophilus sp. TaxID=2653893 RepID=UPI0013BD8FC9|nr:sigma factor [Xylophilus sp.]KAF1047199.1 MAG: putative RNA polymerase sigma factor FecI [Xylophilus sp.]